MRLSRDASGSLVLDDDDRVLRVEHGADRVLEVVVGLGGSAAGEDLVRTLVRGPEDLPEVAGGVARLIRDDVLVRTGAAAPAGRGVVLTVVGEVDTTAVVDALVADGCVVVGPDAPGASLALVLCHDHLDARLVPVLQQHRERGLAVLLVRTGVTRCWIGPLLPSAPEDPAPDDRALEDPAPDDAPGLLTDGVCPACLDQQLRRNGHGPRVATAGSVVVPRTGQASVQRGTAAAVAAAVEAVLDDAPGVRAAWAGGVREFRLRDLEVVHHPVAPCAAPRPASAEDADGGSDAFLDRVAPLVSALTGVLAPVTVRRAAGGQVLAETTHPVRRRDPAAPGGLGWGRAPAWGCRESALDARVAAVGEALERYCVSWHGDEAHERASAAELAERGEPVLLPQDLLLFGEGQRARGAGGPAAEDVPDDLPADLRTDVSPLVSAVTGERWWVPSAAVHFGHPDLEAARCCRPDSSGCAVGPTRPAAVLAGLLELVERDAVALWWWPRAVRPGVPLGVLGPAAERRARRAFARQDRDVWLLDVTSDLGVPVVVALSSRADGTGVVAGFGASVDLAAAAARAVQECGQVLACLEFGVVGPGAPGWAQRSVHDEPYLLPDPTRPATTGTAPAGPAAGGPRTGDRAADADGDLAEVLSRVAGRGIDVLVQDLTRPEVGVPAVRVVAPGLRPWHRRLAPGRLVVAEEAANPWPPPV